jgi:alkanesulfonate monooxygenase SsuD/methylene tetrahydromethanopterin reductase-like flavin-dependent oxidoreductase (luciferase family)
MARTVDHVAGGRFVLGIGSGWFERDYTEYGYEFGTARSRLTDLERDLPIITARLAALNPPPVGDLPIMIGGSGRKVTLRLVAEHAHMWNSFGPPENFAELNGVLNDWCERVGRNPSEIERTVAINPNEVGNWQAYLDAGADHLIVMSAEPFALDALAELVDAARG